MKKQRRSPEQIARHLRDVAAMTASGKTVDEACRELGVSTQTFYGWKKKYGDMSAEELRRLKDLEEENRRLKKMVADRDLDIEILKEAASGNW